MNKASKWIKFVCALLLCATPVAWSQSVNGVPNQAVVPGPNAGTLNNSTGLLQSQAAANSVTWGVHCQGDSNVQGFSLQGGGNNQCKQFGYDTGAATSLVVNNALQSNTCSDLAFRVFNQEKTTELTSPFYYTICGSNESDNPTENTTAQYLGMVQSEYGYVSYLAMAPSEEVFAFGSATLTGSYATDGSTFSQSKGVSTATTGSATIPVQVGKSGVLSCWVYNYTTSSGQYQMLDTTMPTAVALTDTITGLSTSLSQGNARAPNNSGTTWTAGLRFAGLTPGYHLIQQLVTTSGPTGFIGCGSPNVQSKHGQSGSSVLVGNTIPEQYNTNSGFVNNTNANQKIAWNYLTTDFANVIPWDAYSGVNYTTDFDSKAVIGFTVGSVGSGQTNGTYTEPATTYTCSGSTRPYMTYTIAGGVLTAPPVPAVVYGTTLSYAQNCTAAAWTIAHGGTPATVTAILSTNTGYNSAPPFHLSQNGQNHEAQSAEAAAQIAINPPSGGVCSSTGSQSLSGTCHHINTYGAATISLPTTGSNPSIYQQGIVQGTCWFIAQSSGGSTAITTLSGGSGGNASGYQILPNSGATVCLYDSGGIYEITSPPQSGLSQPTNTATYTAGTNVTSVACASGFSCNNTRGTLTIVGGTATTGTIATVTFSAALNGAPFCVVSQNGGATVYGIGNSAPTTTAFNITSAVTVSAATFNVNYWCMQ